MRIANVNGRAALVVGDEIADIATASDGRFGPDPVHRSRAEESDMALPAVPATFTKFSTPPWQHHLHRHARPPSAPPDNLHAA